MAYYFEPPNVSLNSPPAIAGDLLVGRTDGNFDRLAIGANGTFLNVSAGAIRWGNTIDTGGLTITAGLLTAVGALFSSTVTLTTGPLLVGSNPATAGLVRMANNAGGIQARNVTNTANAPLIDLDATNTVQISPFGQAVAIAGNSTFAGFVSVGSTLRVIGKATIYNNINTAGWGIPAVNGYGRATAQAAANASVATFTPAADGSFIISANVLVTTSVTHSFVVECAYVDESGIGRAVTFNVQQLGGTLVTSITNITGAGPYEGVPLHIRAQGGSAITIRTNAAGTYTSVTYNVEGAIVQIA